MHVSSLTLFFPTLVLQNFIPNLLIPLLAANSKPVLMNAYGIERNLICTETCNSNLILRKLVLWKISMYLFEMLLCKRIIVNHFP